MVPTKYPQGSEKMLLMALFGVEIQSGALQQHHQLCRTAGVGIYGSGSDFTTSYKWVLRRFAVYVRTGGMAGLILPVMLCTYVRSIYPCFLPL